MLIGKRINDRYKIKQFIGGGGMANVYLAKDMILERDVAIKILRLDFANDDELIRRFHREAQSATSLVHSNIVNIYDVGEENNIYYIVMEYVEGETLKQYIQRNHPIPIEKIVDIMTQIASAVSHAHQNNIIHRDIKPQNILIDHQGNVKITDFGIAIALTSTTITHTNSVLGSVHYISPEQARGGVAMKKSDIYSLGIVLFEMLTGKLPFSGESAISIALKHLQDETPHPRQWNPSIPQSVENIILKATAKNPLYRYDSVEELKEDLRTCLDPSRINEPLFTLPVDEEQTKAIPVIKNENSFSDIQETIVNETDNEKVKQDESLDKKKKKKRKWPKILILLSVLIITLIVLSITVFPQIFGPKDIVVPDVTNKPLEEAIEELEEARFTISETIEMPDDDIKENYVIKTNPSAGRTKVEGSEVVIYVSSGKERIKLADYTGEQYEEVLQKLKDEGLKFKNIEINQVYDESEPGTIIKQLPEDGEEVIPEETELIFTVSLGEETFVLDDLTQYSENALKNYAESRNIKIEVSDQEYHDTIPEGLVIRQSPEPGTKLKKNDLVKVIVSKGKEQLPVTKQIDLSIVYTGDMEVGEPQQVQIFIEDMNHDFSEPYHSFEMRESTTMQIELTIAPGTTGRYQVVVDGQVVRESDVPYSD